MSISSPVLGLNKQHMLAVGAGTSHAICLGEFYD